MAVCHGSSSLRLGRACRPARAADPPAPPHQPTAASWRIRDKPNCGRWSR